MNGSYTVVVVIEAQPSLSDVYDDYLHKKCSAVQTQLPSSPGGAGKPRTVRYLFFTLICVFTIVIVSLYIYIPEVYFLNTYHQTFLF